MSAMCLPYVLDAGRPLVHELIAAGVVVTDEGHTLDVDPKQMKSTWYRAPAHLLFHSRGIP
jgi:hypothetical protein